MDAPRTLALAAATAALAIGALAAEPVPEAAWKAIRPGTTTRAEMRQSFGQPVEGADTATESYDPAPLKLARLSATYDDGDIVREARIRLAKELPPDVAALLFDLSVSPRTSPGHAFDKKQQAGSTLHYDADGVHLYVRDALVREAVLTAPGAVVRGLGSPPVAPSVGVRPGQPPPARPTPGTTPAPGPAAPQATPVLEDDPDDPIEHTVPPGPATPAAPGPESSQATPVPEDDPDDPIERSPAPGPKTPQAPPVKPEPPVTPAPPGTDPTPIPRRHLPPEFPALTPEPPSPPAIEKPATPKPAVESLDDPLEAVRVAGQRSGGASFCGIVVGVSKRDFVRLVLGEPRSAHALPTGGTVAEYDGKRLRLEKVLIHYGADGVVEAIELRAAPPLALTRVGQALHLSSASAVRTDGETQVLLFGPQGVEIAMEGMGVNTIRLVPRTKPTQTAAVPPKPPAPPHRPAPGPVTPPVPRPPVTPTPPVTTAPGQSAAPDSVAIPPGLRVTRVWHQQRVQAGHVTGMYVYAEVTAGGLNGMPIQLAVGLRRMEGQVVPAASGAPADAVGKQGRLQLTARDTVRHARSVWKAWRVFVPYNAIGLPRGWEVKLMLMVTAECNRKRFTMEVPCTLRLP